MYGLKIIDGEKVERAEQLVVLDVKRLGSEVIAAVRDEVCERGLLDNGCPRLTELPVLRGRRRPRRSPVAAAVRVAAVHVRRTVVVHGCGVLCGWWTSGGCLGGS